MEKPLFRKLFVFAVRERSRLTTKSGFYIPNSKRGMHTRAEDVWILRSASDCILGPWKTGQHVLVADGLELQQGADLWDQYKDLVELEQIKKFSDACEGKVESFVIHEDSILGEVLGDLIQDEPQW